MGTHADSHTPLAGIIVADFSRVLAGPLATMTLADLGATVIKVERPGSGDDTRSWGPPYSATGATYFESVNRNKQSLALDLGDPADLAIARKLALRADVVVENFRPGGFDRLGLGYDSLVTENPGLIYASITGFGSAGGAELLGYDFVVQAVGGLMSITGSPEGDPMKAGVALVDVLTAKDTTIAVLAALHARTTTGRGSRLEINLLSSLQAALANQMQAHLGAGVEPKRLGNNHPSIAPYQLLQCQDKPLAVACGNDGQFDKLTHTLGVPQLAQDERFATNPKRVAHRAELQEELERALATRTADEWSRALTEIGVPAGVVASIGEGVEFARSLGLNPTITVHDEEGNPVGEQIRYPVQWTPPLASRTAAPPTLGEHNTALTEWLRD